LRARGLFDRKIDQGGEIACLGRFFGRVGRQFVILCGLIQKSGVRVLPVGSTFLGGSGASAIMGVERGHDAGTVAAGAALGKLGALAAQRVQVAVHAIKGRVECGTRGDVATEKRKATARTLRAAARLGHFFPLSGDRGIVFPDLAGTCPPAIIDAGQFGLELPA